MVAAATLAFTSCQKEFDPSTYAPPLSIGGYSSSKEIGAPNLVAYWAFDGSLVDSVSNTAGTNTGTSFAVGIKGKSLQGAANSYVLSVPSAKVLGLKSFTITEWVNTPPPTTGIIGLFSLSNKSQFWGNLEIFIENGSSNDNATIKVVFTNNGVGDKTYTVSNIANFFGKWNALSCSYDQATSTVKLYVNGSRLSASKLDGIEGPLNFVNSGNLVFGTTQFMTVPSQTTSHSKEPWADYLVGQLDEVKIYDKALSDDEVGYLAKLEGRGK